MRKVIQTRDVYCDLDAGKFQKEMAAKARLTSFWLDLDHVHVWEVLGSAIEIFVVGILDRPTHVNRCMNVDAFYPCTSLRANGQIKAKKTLPATSPREFETIIAPKE